MPGVRVTASDIERRPDMHSPLLEDFASYLAEKPIDLGRYGLDGVFQAWSRGSLDPAVLKRAAEASGLAEAHPEIYDWLPRKWRDEFVGHLESEGHIRQVIHDWGH